MSILSEMGFKTESADVFARAIFAEPEINKSLARIAGRSSSITSLELRDAIQSDDAVRRQVNSLIHGRVMERIWASRADFVEVPLLIEACLQGQFDSVWVVTCGSIIQRERLVDRYRGMANIDLLLSTQLPTRAKVPFADAIIRTNYPLETVRRCISEALGNRFESS